MNEPHALRFRVHDEKLAIVRLDSDAIVPSWARGGFVTISRTRDELSIVCAEVDVPREIVQTRDKVALGIVGVVPMTTVGLLAALCAALAAASVPVFVISTHDTDWLLISADRFDAARAALEAAGHQVEGKAPTR